MGYQMDETKKVPPKLQVTKPDARKTQFWPTLFKHTFITTDF